MQASHIKNAALALSIFTLGIFVGGVSSFGQSEMAIPTEHKGLSVSLLGTLGEESIKNQIGLEGYEIRLREIVIAPGGAIARHTHAKRPGLVKTIAGSWTEGRSMGENTTPKITEYPAGKQEALLETYDTDHWGWNTGDAPATILVCDVAPPS
jgi:hypothetical protein